MAGLMAVSAFALVGCGAAGKVYDNAREASGKANQANAQACKTEARTLRTAAEAHRAEHGEYPNDVQELVDAGYLRDVDTYRYELEGGGGSETPTLVPTDDGTNAPCPEVPTS